MTDRGELHRRMTEWRHDLHAHPEFGFEEHRTARFVADTLRAIGVDEVIEGVGGTGVVATLTRGTGNRAIALRADMDALRIAEVSEQPYRSTVPGTMHACGHDGHTATLLGAAQMLAEEGGFDGTVRFIFQPAEEWGRGALAMLGDGLLDRFPFEEIYGLHNNPGDPVGAFVTRVGPVMSAEDNFEIVLRGVGGHASRPQAGSETMVPGCELVMALQAIVSRRLDPGATAVVSVTEFLTDGTRNVLPGMTTIRGDVRSFNPKVSADVERHMGRIVEGIAAAHGVTAAMTYTREFVPLVNDADCTAEAFAAARTIMGEERISVADAPITASEDFARFLEHVPGCYAFLGNGVDSRPLHHPEYDFSDAILLDGACYFAAIAQRRLAPAS
ncbi:M20 aminoacylase family protein [Sphingomonas carotinifaciens]|uniref:M20 aminoacylase family protein n=1 Tax=Sphingomonas carotinifaciens TaxID=1166323 RepID=UPI0039A06589